MKTKHTVGQWTATKENKNFVIMSERVYIGSVSSSDMIMSEAEANSKLISSAPNLLHALQMLVNDIERNDGDAINRATLVNEAKQVIDKATS
jgi:hypothetical protein